METDVQGKCWNCGRELLKLDYGREDNCLECGKPTRVCKNCRWYAPGRPNDFGDFCADLLNKLKRVCSGHWFSNFRF